MFITHTDIAVLIQNLVSRKWNTEFNFKMVLSYHFALKGLRFQIHFMSFIIKFKEKKVNGAFNIKITICILA